MTCKNDELDTTFVFWCTQNSTHVKQCYHYIDENFAKKKIFKIQKISNFEILKLPKVKGKRKRKEKALNTSAFPYTKNTHSSFELISHDTRWYPPGIMREQKELTPVSTL